MPDGPIDPATLEGDDLTRWYLRSPEEIEQERQAAAAQRYRSFFGQAEPDPGVASQPPAPLGTVDPAIDRGRNAPAKDTDHSISWVQVGPNQWRSQRTPAATQPAPPRLPQGAGATTAHSQPAPGGFLSPLDMARNALHDFQSRPKIPRPNLAESFIPVIGPAWEAAGDLQDGNYGGAAFNAAMAVGDALPLGAIFKGAKAAEKGIGILKKGSVSANAAAKQIRKAGLAGTGEEIHHTIPLNGTSRTAQDWRNHYAFLKTLPQETHRRLTGSWNGKPQFDPIRRMWYGTTDWQKSVPAALGSYAADAWENLTHPFAQPGGAD